MDLGFQRARQPAQKEQRRTHLLTTARELLAGGVGLRALSLNELARHAEMAKANVYRYFPNKYALLHELGRRLMQAQNVLVEQWATPATLRLPTAALAQSIYTLYEQTLVLTRELPEGIWVTRALRAVPVLTPVRIESHAYVTGLIERAFLQAYPSAPVARVGVLARLAVELVYAAMEMLFDEPTLDTQAVGQSLANMLAQEVQTLRREAQRARTAVAPPATAAATAAAPGPSPAP